MSFRRDKSPEAPKIIKMQGEGFFISFLFHFVPTKLMAQCRYHFHCKRFLLTGLESGKQGMSDDWSGDIEIDCGLHRPTPFTTV